MANVPDTAELLARIEELSRRVEWLEATVNPGSAPSASLSPDVVLAISAAVAAYLGKRAPVRQIRVSGARAWAQQGRAAAVGTHDLTRGAR